MQAIPQGHYLVVYDYGMGGVWWLVRAGSPDEIHAASPELTVVNALPEWMELDDIERDDIRDPRTKALQLILARAS